MVKITVIVEEIKPDIINIDYEGTVDKETDGEVQYGKVILDQVEEICQVIAAHMAQSGQAIHICGPTKTTAPALEKIRDDIMSGRLNLEKAKPKPKRKPRRKRGGDTPEPPSRLK